MAGAFLILQRHAAAAERSGYRAVKQLQTGRKLEAQAARDAARQNEANSVTSPSDSGGSALSDDAAPAGTRRDGQATGNVREFQRPRGPKTGNRTAPS
ncbi:MAG: hypothetical protein ABSF98_04620 [Bryobacteraceae bacterium]|jgi:hypothetical protein